MGVEITPTTPGNGGNYSISSPEGTAVGSVVLGPTTDTYFLAFTVGSTPPANSAASVSVDINLFDAKGNPITSLTKPITICLASNASSSVCFSLFFFSIYLFLFKL